MLIMAKIDKRIAGYKVLSNNTGVEDVVVTTNETPVAMGTPCITVAPITKDTVLERPEKLFGFTHKLKAPQLYNHGIFITLNYMYEEGTAIPFEIFFNTKNRELTAWLETVSLTITTLFRTRVDITHLLEEYRTIQDSKGGYRGKIKSWEEKPKYYTSILGEIADVIEHFLGILEGMNAAGEELHPNYPVQESRKAPATAYINEEPPLADSNYPPNATTCPSCSAKAMVLMDGCYTCVQCGFSKCN